MYCELRAGLYAAVSGSRTIFLDLRQNRYFAVTPAADAALQRLQQQPASADDLLSLAPLVQAGLLVGDPARHALRPPALPSAPTGALQPASRASAKALIVSLSWQWRAQWLLRRRSLLEIGTGLRASRDAIIAEEQASTLTIDAAAFGRTGWLFPSLDRCLPRSLAFCLVSHRRGVRALLVFGIRANPFAAHAWAQHGAMVLNDTLERVGPFTPILAL